VRDVRPHAVSVWHGAAHHEVVDSYRVGVHQRSFCAVVVVTPLVVLGVGCSSTADDSEATRRRRSTSSSELTTTSLPPPTTAPSLTPEGAVVAATAFKPLEGYQYVDPPQTAMQSFENAISQSSELLGTFDGFGVKAVWTSSGQAVASLIALSIRPTVADRSDALSELLVSVSPFADVQDATLVNERVTVVDDKSGLQRVVWPHERVIFIALGPDRTALDGVMAALIAASGRR
jgi:hypothetical protein